MTVLYKASNSQFNDAYNWMSGCWELFGWCDPKTGKGGRIYDFVEEQDFRTQVIEIVEQSRTKYFSFFVDDQILYRPIDFTEGDLDAIFDAVPEVSCVSLRLGLNCRVQDIYTNSQSIFPQTFHHFGNFLMWDWRFVPPNMNFGYPLSVDCHIFRRKEILDLLRDTKFDSPNSLEGNLQQLTTRVKPYMACGETSYIVNSPSNRVQDIFQNNAGKFYGLSAVELNDAFLTGKRLSLEKTDFSNIQSPHQELPLFWE